jgi:NAD(P)-dependent dehydrogenase (short-subunit alcohol dehydrogenase family)
LPSSEAISSEGAAKLPIRFDGQTVIVTGAGRGLGASYARLIAARGGAVVVHDAGVAQDGSGFDPSVAEAVVAEIGADGGNAAAFCDNLEDPAACSGVVEFAVSRFGRLDALVHNAGLVVFADLEQTNPAVWDRMVAIGINAPFHLARAAVPHMLRQGYGRIVLTTSGRAMRVENCVPGLIAYSTTKMAQLGLMVGLATELRETGIRVNAISPVAATRVLRRAAPELKPESVAPGVALLASSACSFSGVVLHAAGGRFSVSSWGRSDGIDLGPFPATPEGLAIRWQEIAGRGGKVSSPA